jgi:tRNA pseudouridine38-40 synthase
MRFFITFSYDGARYHGWQVQPNAVSVQGVINEALSTLLRSDIKTTGAGRTDTGVNAKKMVAHFDTNVEFDSDLLVKKLNRILPPDISIQNIRRVADNCHSRFDAKFRTYHYYVHTRKNPFYRHYAMSLHYEPDYVMMNLAAQQLLGMHDFTSFSKLHTDVKTNFCNVISAQWVNIEDDLWRFEITADRFLRNMVRAIVGTLLEVGRMKITIEDFKKIIETKDRCAAGDSVPGHALTLVDVVYEY